jgi:hypothetical protein
MSTWEADTECFRGGIVEAVNFSRWRLILALTSLAQFWVLAEAAFPRKGTCV